MRPLRVATPQHLNQYKTPKATDHLSHKGKGKQKAMKNMKSLKGMKSMKSMKKMKGMKMMKGMKPMKAMKWEMHFW